MAATQGAASPACAGLQAVDRLRGEPGHEQRTSCEPISSADRQQQPAARAFGVVPDLAIEVDDAGGRRRGSGGRLAVLLFPARRREAEADCEGHRSRRAARRQPAGSRSWEAARLAARHRSASGSSRGAPASTGYDDPLLRGSTGPRFNAGAARRGGHSACFGMSPPRRRARSRRAPTRRDTRVSTRSSDGFVAYSRRRCTRSETIVGDGQPGIESKWRRPSAAPLSRRRSPAALRRSDVAARRRRRRRRPSAGR